MRRRRAPLIAGVAAIVVLLLVSATVAVVLATRDRYPMTGRSVWSLSDPDDTDSTHGAWITADSVVFGEDRGGQLTALARQDGSVRWRFRLPAPGRRTGSGRICTTSTDLVDGALAVGYQPAGSDTGRDCVGLLLLDLATGKPRWTSDAGSSLTKVEAAAGLVLAMNSDHRRVSAFDPGTGARRWTRDTGCVVYQIAGSRRRIGLVAGCGVDTEEGQAWTLDPATGVPLSRLTLSQARASDDVHLATWLSLEPMVLLHRKPSYRVSVLAPDGTRVANEFPVHEPKYAVTWHGRDREVVVTESRLVMPTEVHGLVAWDLRSGGQLWDRGGSSVDDVDPRGYSFPHLVAAGDAEIVMVLDGGGDGPRLLRVDPATGGGTALSPQLKRQEAPFGTGMTMSWDGSRLYVVNNRGSSAIAFSVE